MKLPEQIACPHCGAHNRLGLGLCKKCMRHMPKVEDIKKEIEDSMKSKKKVVKEEPVKKEKPKYRFNLHKSEE